MALSGKGGGGHATISHWVFGMRWGERKKFLVLLFLPVLFLFFSSENCRNETETTNHMASDGAWNIIRHNITKILDSENIHIFCARKKRASTSTLCNCRFRFEIVDYTDWKVACLPACLLDLSVWLVWMNVMMGWSGTNFIATKGIISWRDHNSQRHPSTGKPAWDRDLYVFSSLLLWWCKAPWKLLLAGRLKNKLSGG